MVHAQFQARAFRRVLQVFFEDVLCVTVAAATIASDQQSPGLRTGLAAVFLPQCGATEALQNSNRQEYPLGIRKMIVARILIGEQYLAIPATTQTLIVSVVDLIRQKMHRAVRKNKLGTPRML